MKNNYYKYLREDVIFHFILTKSGGINQLLNQVNTRIAEINPNKTIDIRTLQIHIKELKEIHGWPIDKTKNFVSIPGESKKVKVFKFSEDFNRNKLRKDEKENIQESFEILKRFIDVPGFEWLETIIDEGDQLMNIDFFKLQILQFDEGLTYMRKFFNIFKQAIIDECALRINRRTIYKNKIESIEFHPHYLKLWKNKWYAFGSTNKLDTYVIPIDKYNLDISSVPLPLKTKFIKSKTDYCGNEFDKWFFRDIIGVTNDKLKIKQKIKLRIHNNYRFMILNSKPPHHSWKVINKCEDYSDIEMTVKLNNELYNFILEWTPDIEVIEPSNLKDNIFKRIEKSYKMYTN